MASSTRPGTEFSLPLQWIDFEETPILFTNHFLAQHQSNEFVLTFGQVTGPPVVGTPDQIRDASGLGHVPIQATLREHDRIHGAST